MASERTAVVVASPDVATRTQVRLVLGEQRYEFREAEDTDDVVFAVVERTPRLLVLDLTLDGAGALAVARSVREQQDTSSVRVLLLAPRARTPEAAPGVDAVVGLPTTAPTLLRAVKDLLAAP